MEIYRVVRNDCWGFNNWHLVLHMQPHVISFYGVTSRIRFMFLLFPQVFRNWRHESEPPLKPSPLTCYKQFGTNSIIVLMFVESQRVTCRASVRYVTKTWSVALLNKKTQILLSQVYCVEQVVKTPTFISNNPVFNQKSIKFLWENRTWKVNCILDMECVLDINYWKLYKEICQ